MVSSRFEGEFTQKHYIVSLNMLYLEKVKSTAYTKVSLVDKLVDEVQYIHEKKKQQLILDRKLQRFSKISQPHRLSISLQNCYGIVTLQFKAQFLSANLPSTSFHHLRHLNMSQPTEPKAVPKKEKKPEEEELSEEDAHLKSELDQLVDRLKEPNSSQVYASSMSELKRFIKDSTSSMTAVPKPLKFLRPRYQELITLHSSWQDNALKRQLADILSVLGMTYSVDDSEGEYKRESLKYRLQSSFDDIGDWGHEYMRHLALEIGEAYEEEIGKTVNNSKTLIELSLQIVPFFLHHNAEAEAVDLLLEIESIKKLPQFVDKNTFERVCLYLVSCVPLLAPPDDIAFLSTAFTIYLANSCLTQALTLAIRLDDEQLIESVFNATSDETLQKQLGFLLARQNSCFRHENPQVQECIGNVKKSEYFKYLVKELNLTDPRVPEDVYKSHLETSFSSSSQLESAKQNLASAFVSGLVNAGFGSEKLISDEKWIFKTKDSGMVSATATLGLVNVWDCNEGLQKLDEYMYVEQPEIKAGALLGMGISSSSVHDEMDPALLLLQDYLNNNNPDATTAMVASAIDGLGIAFAGNEHEEVLNLLLPLISDHDQRLEISASAALALGHVFVGTCNGDITSQILQTLLERDAQELTSKWVRFMSLGLGLLFMGKHDQVADVLGTIQAIEHPIAQTLKCLVRICSYAGTGNVVQIQNLLEMCTKKEKAAEGDEQGGDDDIKAEQVKDEEPQDEEVKDEPKEESADKDEPSDSETTPEGESYQAYAVLGLALIAMGEDIGQEMSLRHFSHLMHYGNPLIRRCVPLAMGLVSASNPQMKVFDTLSRYSHDPDIDVAINAIFAMGIVGAGTNNARLAQLLRQLASYYSKEKDALFMVRIAQGLVHMGKGTLSLSPFNTERSILSKVALAGLLTVAVTLVDPKSFILEDQSKLLFYLVPSIHPRMLITVDETLAPIKVNVRVGQAVDVVGQAGKPKTITGWVTHSTPVLLNYGEKAELETDEYLSLTHSLEGVAILKKNPDYVEQE